MIAKIIITILAALELFFIIYSVRRSSSDKRAKAFAKIGSAALIILLMIFGVLTGFARYAGVIVLLLAAGGLGLLSFKRKGEDTQPKVFKYVMRSVGFLLLCTLALIPAFLFPQFRPVKATGDKSILTDEYKWVDESRTDIYSPDGSKRFVEVRFYYPEAEGK